MLRGPSQLDPVSGILRRTRWSWVNHLFQNKKPETHVRASVRRTSFAFSVLPAVAPRTVCVEFLNATLASRFDFFKIKIPIDIYLHLGNFRWWPLFLRFSGHCCVVSIDLLILQGTLYCCSCNILGIKACSFSIYLFLCFHHAHRIVTLNLSNSFWLSHVSRFACKFDRLPLPRFGVLP